MNKNKQPILVGRFWHMPDGSKVPNIYGGNDENDEEKIARLEKELKAANGEAAGNRKDLTALKKATEGFDPVAFKKMQEAQEKATQDKDVEKGNFEKALADMNTKHEAALAASNERGDKLFAQLEKQVVDNQLMISTGKAVNQQHALTLMKAEHTFNVSDEGVVEVMKDGKPLFGEKGKPVTPAEAMADFLTANPNLVSASDKQGSGGGDQGKGKGGEKTTQAKVVDGLTELLGGK